jgi:hypothetical protein
MHQNTKYLQWVEAERRAVEGAHAFFKAALDWDAPVSPPVPDAEDVAALRAEADACYEAAMAELAELGERSSTGEDVAKNQLINAESSYIQRAKL